MVATRNLANSRPYRRADNLPLQRQMSCYKKEKRWD